MSVLVRLERGRYHDSVTLMRASTSARDRAGVETVIAAMATELNLALLDEAGFGVPDATADDLVIAVRADNDAHAEAAVAAVERVLADRRTRPSAGARWVPPHTVEAAGGHAPEAGIVLVSVPGPHAYVEAAAALRAGRHVMVFSDGVDLDAEVALKREAAAVGRLVMGPDCGTAILGGVGLGFANVVVPGPVGVVAASGTGAQQLCCLLDEAGIGVRHVVGVGGRDLTAAVGGASALAALPALDADPAVEVIVVVSKPADPEVAARVADAAAACRTRVIVAAVGPGRPTLTATAAEVAAALGRSFPEPACSAPAFPVPPRRGPLLGLFSGGTNCAEAIVVLDERLGPVWSNVHTDRSRCIDPNDDHGGHVLIDLGDDQLTAGRPHPMIDPGRVAERVSAAAGAARDDVAGVSRGPGVVVLDVVLGLGAHPDPAAVLVPAIGAATAAGIAVVVTLIGTAGDPQGLDVQTDALVGAGAIVHRSNARAVERAGALAIAGNGMPTPSDARAR